MEAINLDLLPGAMPPIVHVSQGDVGRQFKISIYDDTGAAYSLTGKTLSIVGHKGDGNVFQYAIPSSAISGNTVTITTEEQMTPAAGKALCEIRIEQNDTKLGTCNFVMDVEQGPADMGSLSISALYMIDALFERAETDIATATAAAATATQKATEATTSATNAASSASTANTAATNASNSATAASNSATAASTSATTAATSETNAATSASEASVSASNASTYATAASTSADAAATSAGAASTSASNASTYATAADNSADAAEGYATAASQSATAAATSASNASTSETNAASSASDAANSASDAASSESNASTSASNAATYATNSSNSATASANSASAAASSATAAEDAKEAIEDMTVSAESVAYTVPASVEKTIVEDVVNLNFKIPRGEPTSGHDVEANPAGAATGGDITKLGIDGTVYNVSGLPDYTQASQNDILTIGQSGPEWAPPTGGGGDVFTQKFFDYSMGIANVYSDRLCTDKLYAREDDTPFTFSANTDYYLETEVYQLAGQQIFIEPVIGWWLGYFAKADTTTYNIATAYDLPILEEFGNVTSLMLPPDTSTASIVGINNFSGITGEKNIYKQLIMPVKPADVNVNEVDDKITLKSYFKITPTTSFTWTPSLNNNIDFTISCTNGQLTMSSSAREL